MSEKSKKLINRLKRIEGHVESVAKMIENQQDSYSIFIQMKAVQSAFNKVFELFIEDSIKQSVIDKIDKNLELKNPGCTGCSQFPNIKKSIKELE